MIAVAGGKGGSGKTTTTLGLARALAGLDGSGPVVAADADWDLPNLASLASAVDRCENARRGPDRKRRVNPDREPTRGDEVPTVVEAARGSHQESTARVEPSAPTVLAAPDDPTAHDACELLSSLDDTVSTDSTVLVDCPAGAAPDVAAPLRVADGTVLVTQLRPAALRDTAKTAAMARALDCPPVGVVAVRAESPPDGLDDLLGCPTLGAVPSRPPTPLAADDVRSAYDRVARTLVSSKRLTDSQYRQTQAYTANR
ncbi:MinD/ParA family ATP-binding protein [Halorubrum sp. DTA98]|uniref:MinD/ParA family ATP-binding protein n=1 Tax=Halorubrum sp. DTA98 TaxID=3402163 RepID=UPI003AACA0EC